MNFLFYNITCDPLLVDKSRYIPTGTQPTEILLKQPPSDTMQFEIVTERDLDSYNYCYVSELHGYYNLSEPVIISNTLKAYTLTKDVLFSNVGAILNLQCMVERSESHGNGWLNDSLYPISAKNKVISKNFPNALENDSIILITVG